MKVNEKIRAFREMNDLTQEEMALKLALSTNGYANIERGETKLSFERLEQIANVLGVDVTELISYGETNHINFSHSTTHTNNSLNIIGRISDEIWELEISRLQLTISHKDELLEAKSKAMADKEELLEAKNQLIEQQKKEIDTLKLLVETLSNK